MSWTRFAKLGSQFAELGSQLDAEHQAALAELRAAQEQLARQRKCLEEEKEAMRREGIRDSDIIDLNVCGTVMAARRRTLCLFNGSLLEAMFSGRWPEQSLSHDAKGRVFLDFNPVCFRSLLNDLLYEERHPGCNAVCSLYPRSACAKHPCHSHRRDLLDMLDHLGLVPAATPIHLRASGGVTVTPFSGCHRILQTRGSPGYEWVLGEEPLPALPSVTWDVHVLSGWVFMGVLLGPSSAPPEPSAPLHRGCTEGETDAGCYGWSTNRTYTAGVGVPVEHGPQLLPGDRVTLTLAASACTLTQVTLRGDAALPCKTVSLPRLAGEQAWWVHLHLYDEGSMIETTEVRQLRS